MKIFLFSSPYQYYADNLIPLAKYLEREHQIWSSYRLNIDGPEYDMITQEEVSYSQAFLKNQIKPDLVYLVQSWWYQDAAIAQHCRKKEIPFDMVDHAPPMMRYTQKDGKKSHLYRKDCGGVRNYFSYGQMTVDLMRKIGFSGKNYPVGSSRLEQTMRAVQNSKDGFVLFDTSNKMEDANLVEEFISLVKANSTLPFIIQEHSRSPHFFRKALKYSNVILNQDLKESQLFEYSDFIFSFPSSAMLVPALLNKKIIPLYQNHFCSEARKYYQKYNFEQDLEKFINENIYYQPNQSTESRIASFLGGK